MITEELKKKANEMATRLIQPQIDRYAKMYLKGYEDALKTMPHEPITDEYDKFFDYMLDSGTMWTNNWHKDKPNSYQSLSYYEAKEYGLPTKEQFEELLANCRELDGTYRGRNGQPIGLPIFSPFENHSLLFWVKSDVVDNEAIVCRFTSNSAPTFGRLFTGTPLYFFRVKNKNDQ